MVLSPMGLGIAWGVLPSVSSVPADPSSCVTVIRRLQRAPFPAQGARPALSCSKGAQGTAELPPPRAPVQSFVLMSWAPISPQLPAHH